MRLDKYDLSTIKEHVESLRLDMKTNLTVSNMNDLVNSLRESREDQLANAIQDLEHPNALEDFLVNTLYG